MKNTILAISPELPYPPTKGSWVDIWGQLLFFHQEGWRIVLAVCGQPPEMAKASNDLPIDIDVHFFPGKSLRWSFSENSQTVLGVQKLIDQHEPQVVLCEYADWVPLASALNLNRAQLWFRPINFELPQSLIKIPNTFSWRFWQGTGSFMWLARWIKTLGFTLPHVFATEFQMHRIADHLFFNSYGDMQVMSRLYGGTVPKDWVLPFIEREMVPVKDTGKPLNVIYTATNYYPTSPMQLAGAYKLLEQIIPAVEAAMPEAFHFHFVGRGSREQLTSYASEVVLIHDFVEDLPAFLQQIDVCCAPVELGWGIKIKMIEAMASGLPVVGAPQTFRGVPSVEGAYFVCRTTEDYVAAFRSLQDLETRKRVATAAREAYLSWLNEGQQILREALRSIARSPD